MKNKLFNLNQPLATTANNEQRTKYTPLIRQFKNIAGYTGCFINGLHPYFLFQCTRSGLTTHPLWFDGPINSFVPLKNSSITLSGFIYLNKKNDIRICTLPVDDFNGKCPIYYDSQWILRKIQLRQSVHFIVYHEESKTYTCITSVSESTNQLMQLGGEDKEVESYPRDENFILPHREQFSMQLYTSSTWEPLPLCKFVMSEWEHVTCLKLIKLPYEGHSSGFRSYIVVSTSNCYNEDVNSRGRIIIFDIIEVEPEPGQPLTSIKIKVKIFFYLSLSLSVSKISLFFF
jgi:cleavage and polyadenylation specificity factor subunit 1